MHRTKGALPGAGKYNPDGAANYREAMRGRHAQAGSMAGLPGDALKFADWIVKSNERARDYLMIEVYDSSLTGDRHFQVFDFYRPVPSQPLKPAQLYTDNPHYQKIVLPLRSQR